MLCHTPSRPIKGTSAVYDGSARRTSASLLDMACNFALTVCSKRIFGGASCIHKRRLMRYEMTEQTPSVRVCLLKLPSAPRAFALGEGGSQHPNQADSAQ